MRLESELGGTGQRGRETNGFGDSAMNRSVSLIHNNKNTIMNTKTKKRNEANLTQVGDFGWGPGFPSDDPEHRCAFHYYGDHHQLNWLT